jgi:hypothetical protein
VLYEMTEALLSSALRESTILASKEAATFKQVRPKESLIDAWYHEVALIWDVLIEVVPSLDSEPAAMRTHNPAQDDQGKQDHLWFWPIGQQMLSRIVRTLIDKSAVPDDADIVSPLDRDAVRQAVEVLSRIDWDLHALPWRHLVLVRMDQDWKMRSEGRANAMKVAQELLLWMTGLLDLGDDGVDDLRTRWEFALYPSGEDVDDMWSSIVETKVIAQGGHL